MIQEFLSTTEHAGWPLAAFIVFFVTFVGVIVFLLRGLMARKSYDHTASLPLDDDEPGRTNNGGLVR